MDDTSVRHAHRDGCTTQIGDDCFTMFRTGRLKSREAFLLRLLAGHGDYFIDEEALAYTDRSADPTRFGKSGTVGAYSAFRPKKYQSDETDRDGGVSEVDDAMVPTALKRRTSCRGGDALL